MIIWLQTRHFLGISGHKDLATNHLLIHLFIFRERYSKMKKCQSLIIVSWLQRLGN